MVSALFPSVQAAFNATNITCSAFLYSCATISSILHAETAVISVCPAYPTQGISTDPGQTCWSQDWSSHSLDHPSDCQSQPSSHRTCSLTKQMWSSVLRSSPQSSHCKTDKNIWFGNEQVKKTHMEVMQWNSTGTLTKLLLCSSTCFHDDHR